MRLFARRKRALEKRLETERFVLEPIGWAESVRISNCWRTDPEILVGITGASRPYGFFKWMRSEAHPNAVTRFSFAIVPKAGPDGGETDGKPIGIHMIKLRGHRSASNLVALHDRDWWGEKVVLEVRAALMTHVFASGEVDRFFGVVKSRNVSSVFNYRRLGYDHVGTWHRDTIDPVTGAVSDTLHFEIFREKWEAGPWAK